MQSACTGLWGALSLIMAIGSGIDQKLNGLYIEKCMTCERTVYTEREKSYMCTCYSLDFSCLDRLLRVLRVTTACG